MKIVEFITNFILRANNKIICFIRTMELNRTKKVALKWYKYFLAESKYGETELRYRNRKRATHYLIKIKEIDEMLKEV